MKINLGNMGDALIHVTKTLSDGSGLMARGTRLNAAAERDADLTRAQTISDVEQIEKGMMEYREGNLRATLEKAAPMMEHIEDPKIEDMDWVVKWYEKTSRTSDEEIQRWWAKILAGEAETPGSFSKWALDAVSCMSKEDVEAFRTLGSCVWTFGPEKTHQEVVYWESSRSIIPLKEYVLQRTGLATGFGSPLVGMIQVSYRKAYIRYFDEKHAMIFPESLEVERGSTISLTLLGKELLTLCDATPNEEYKRDCIAQWGKHGVEHLSEQKGSKQGKS